MEIENTGSHIRHLRELLNLTQEFMAGELEISIRAYSKIESGESNINLKRLSQIASILGIPLTGILRFNEKDVLKKLVSETHNQGENGQFLKSDELIELYKKYIEHLENEISLLYKIIEKGK